MHLVIKKVLFRLLRIVTFRKGIYCNYGKGCHFRHGVFIDEATQIGSYNYVGEYTRITASKVGNYCSIAPFVCIGLGEHNINGVTTSERINSIFYRDSMVDKPIQIENDVWIGTHATVLRGVKVSNGAVIAAGAVVTKDVPPYAVVAGVPAKIIKYRKDEKDILAITSSNWWYANPKDAAEIIRSNDLK